MARATLQYNRDHARCLIPLPGDQFQILEFDRTTSVTLLNLKSRVVTYPSIIRFLHNNQTYYFTEYPNAGGLQRQQKCKPKELFEQLKLICKSQEISIVPSSPWKKWVGLVFVCVALANIAGAIYAGHRFALLQGPTLVATNDASEVFTATSRYLYQLNSRGKFQNKYPLNSLGIPNEVTEIQPLEGDRLLIGNGKTGTIKECQLDRNLCQTLPGFQGDAEEGSLSLGRYFKFVVSPQQELIYATDREKHRLVVLDLQGREIESTRGEGVLLCSPNGATLTNAGNLAIADTKNSRVLTWSTDAVGRNLKPDRSIDMVQSPKPEIPCVTLEQSPFEIEPKPIALSVARMGVIFPTFVKQDNRGFWWVVLENSDFKKQDLLRFDPDWNNPIRVDLPPDREISDIAIGPQRLIVADSDRFELFSVFLSDLSVEEFGDQQFNRLMRTESIAKFDLLFVAILLSSFTLVLFMSWLLLMIFWNQRLLLGEIARLDPTLK
ncbi:MAG: hypothetical protein ACRC8Y_24330 [Chroococcales cyanobacterium]